jgi:hypothetical protein
MRRPFPDQANMLVRISSTGADALLPSPSMGSIRAWGRPICGKSHRQSADVTQFRIEIECIDIPEPSAEPPAQPGAATGFRGDARLRQRSPQGQRRLD